MTEGVVVDGQAAGSGLSQVERVVDTFIAPSKTFTDILRNTTWWLPFLLAVVVTIGVTFVIDKQVGFERVVENVIHASPKQEDQLSSLTPEQRTARMKGMAVGYRYTSYASPIFILVFSAIGALVLWGSFNFGLGAQTTFGQMFCLWMYCSLPRLLSGLLTVVTIYFGGNAESFDLKDPVGTNIGYYLPDAAPWLKTALGFFDVIGIWTLVLLVIGTAIVAKVSRGKAAAVIVGWWALILIISVATTAAFN
jgi:Yip1 domain